MKVKIDLGGARLRAGDGILPSRTSLVVLKERRHRFQKSSSPQNAATSTLQACAPQSPANHIVGLNKMVMILATVLVSTGVLRAAPTKYSTVEKMLEELTDYSAEAQTFKLIAKNPLHIQVSPRVYATQAPKITESVVHMAAVETVFRAFIHTTVSKITVTVIPKTIVIGGGKEEDYLDQYRVSLTATRKGALKLLNQYFPGKSFDDLMATESIADSPSDDFKSKLFNQITFPDQGPPGVETVFADLAQHGEQ